MNFDKTNSVANNPAKMNFLVTNTFNDKKPVTRLLQNKATFRIYDTSITTASVKTNTI